MTETEHIEHGTVAGFQKEYRLKIPPCRECRDAIAEYQRAYRQQNPGVDLMNQARRYALARLREKYRQEYEGLRMDRYHELIEKETANA